MTQDFAKKKRTQSSSKSTAKKKTNNRRRPSQKPKAPAWAWLVIGLLLAALITLLIYLANKPAPKETVTTKPESNSQEIQQQPPQPRFDFYTILKDRKVEVVDRSAEIKAAAPSNIHYFLQASSFRNQSDAETLRATLLLINLPVNIEQKTNDNGSIWHRVMVGPFTSRSKMAKAQSTLASQNLRPLVIKRTIDE